MVRSLAGSDTPRCAFICTFRMLRSSVSRDPREALFVARRRTGCGILARHASRGSRVRRDRRPVNGASRLAGVPAAESATVSASCWRVLPQRAYRTQGSPKLSHTFITQDLIHWQRILTGPVRMTVDRPRKIGLREFAQAVFQIRQYDTGRRVSEINVNRSTEIRRHGGRRPGRLRLSSRP